MARVSRVSVQRRLMVSSNMLITKKVVPNGLKQLDSIKCEEVTIIALKSNTDSIFIGDENLSEDSFGVELLANESYTFRVCDSSLIRVLSKNATDGVSIVTI